MSAKFEDVWSNMVGMTNSVFHQKFWRFLKACHSNCINTNIVKLGKHINSNVLYLIISMVHYKITF